MEVFFVDQSGKVEQTNRDTVVAATDGKSVAVVIRSRDKQRLFARAKQSRRKNLYLRVFAYAIFRAIETLLHEDARIVIDAEYPGKEHTIIEMLCDFSEENGRPLNPKRIEFDCIGKQSKAHGFSVNALKADRVILVSEEELESAIG